MKEDLNIRVKVAIENSKNARDLFIEKMLALSESLGHSNVKDRDLSNKQTFGPPATLEAILKLENELNTHLPPSYRCFLEINNGWKVVDGSQSFFSIDEIRSWKQRVDPSNWMSIASGAGHSFVNDCVVIGASDDSTDKYLINPKKIKNGEWQFIDFGRNGFAVFDSFLDFLVDTKDQFIESTKEMDLGDYFDPFAEDQ